MKQSESVTKLLESFSKAQAEFPTLPKDKNGYNYRYTDLDTVISTVRPILAKYSMGFMQALTTLENGRWAISTRIFNTSGEWIEDTTTLPDVSLAKGNAAQNVGAAITYMKRYTLCAMLGISSDEDPDGKPDGNVDYNARAQQNTQKPAPKPAQKKPAKLPFTPKGGETTPEEQKRIKELCGAKYDNGTPVFTMDEVKLYSSYRKDKTAKQLIEFIEHALKNRRPDAPELAQDTFPEDIPFDTESGKAGEDKEIIF